MDLALFIFKAWANPKSPTSLSGHRTALWWEGDSRQDIRKTGCLAMWVFVTVSILSILSIPCFGMSFLWILVACLFDVWLFCSLRSPLFLGETSVAPQTPPKRAIARKSHNFGPANFLVPMMWTHICVGSIPQLCWWTPFFGIFAESTPYLWVCFWSEHVRNWYTQSYDHSIP